VVNFPTVPFNFPFANYLIVVLDTDYQYAAVTDPFKSTLFVLSRSPQLEPDAYQTILQELAALNINTERLLLTPQPTVVF
jgi:apolipoprotein D and lipocalin family protein